MKLLPSFLCVILVLWLLVKQRQGQGHPQQQGHQGRDPGLDLEQGQDLRRGHGLVHAVLVSLLFNLNLYCKCDPVCKSWLVIYSYIT